MNRKWFSWAFLPSLIGVVLVAVGNQLIDPVPLGFLIFEYCVIFVPVLGVMSFVWYVLDRDAED